MNEQHEEVICPHCNGTGEVGAVRHPGTRCGDCGGKGVFYVEAEALVVEPVEGERDDG